ncbi:hypothetical protein IV203_007425 [Nitzschia inconspicua]|uniref:Uncharacterized protein n=1 Tax=Nitzschia inconspicua TaxID=303405 RepID=A0A9K3KER0_9STRA|nr:hypothetical protein IV203_007425 [Nitzschia inconspicua]
MLHNAQHDTQSWNDLLDSSEGALEVRKCMCHLAHIQFTSKGSPVLQSFVPDRLGVQVQVSGPHGTTVPIKYLQPTTYRKTLACYTPSGWLQMEPTSNQRECNGESYTGSKECTGSQVHNAVLHQRIPP